MPMRTLPDAPSDAGIRPAGVSRRSGPLKFSAPASEAGGAATTPRLNPLEMPIPAGRPTSPSTLERHRIDLATISTHQRILLREPGEINTSEDWLSSSQASQDKRELVKATRRLVKKKLANPAKTFNRVLAVPEDEQAVIEFRRETQEDEWKQILAKSSKRSRSAASRSRVSGSDSFADSFATSATSGATRTSQVTAGFKSEERGYEHPVIDQSADMGPMSGQNNVDIDASLKCEHILDKSQDASQRCFTRMLHNDASSTVLHSDSQESGVEQSEPSSSPNHDHDIVDEMTMVLDRFTVDRSMFPSTSSASSSEQYHVVLDQDGSPDHEHLELFNHQGMLDDVTNDEYGDIGDGNASDGHNCFLMVQNLPHYITYDTLIDYLHRCGFEGCYTAIYMPMNLQQRRGKGYAFLGMSSPGKAEELRQCWHKKKDFDTGWRKPLAVKFAARQGLAANVEKWRRSNTGRIRDLTCRPRFFTATEF